MSVRKLVDPRSLRMPTVVAGRVPPHNLEAEAAVLSACLLKKDTIARVQSVLGDDGRHFYSEGNAFVYEAICAVAAASGKPVDLVTVAEQLRDRERLPLVGGTAYLAQIVDATPAVSNVVAHALIVQELSQLRGWIAAAQKGVAYAYGGVGDPRAFMAEHNAALEAYARGDASVGPTMMDVAAATLRAELAEAKQRRTLGGFGGLSTGWDALDRKTGGLEIGGVTYLSAPTKMGKTTIAMNFVRAISHRHEKILRDGVESTRPQGTCIISLEQTASELAHTMGCVVGRVNRGRFAVGEQTPEDESALEFGMAAFDALPVVVDARTDTNASNLRARVREARWELLTKRGAPLRLVMIDTLQLLATGAGTHDPKQEQAIVDGAGREIRKLSMDPEFAGVAWLVLSQENEFGKLRGSRALEHHLTRWYQLSVADDDEDHPFSTATRKIARIDVRLARKLPPKLYATAYYDTSTGELEGGPAWT